MKIIQQFLNRTGIDLPPFYMKNLLFVSLTFLFLSGTVQSQHVNFGIKGGLNAYTVAGDNTPGYNPKLGFHAGMLGHIHINPHFAIQPELVFSAQGTTFKANGLDNKLKLNYLNIPLNFQYMFDNGFRLQVGPQLGILTSAKLKTGDINSDTKPNFKVADIGITVGFSYVKPSTGLGIDIRYNHGLSNINANNSINSYNRGVQLGLFYLFGHKS